MATIVNNPGNGDSGSGMGMIVAVIVLLAVVLLFFVYGLPAIRQAGSPQINVPSEIDVNVTTPDSQPAE